jgi:hypothetical protein
MKSEPSAT